MSRHLGFILNVTDVAEPGTGRAVVHLYGKLRDGRPFLVRDRRPQPYFYLESSACEQARALGATELQDAGRRTLQGTPVHRVRLQRPQDAPALRARLHRRGVRTFEADVRFPYRYLIDRGIRSALLIEGQPRPLRDWAGAPRDTVVFDEPELAPAQWTPALTTLSLDIETDPEAQRLLSVALWGCGAREVLLWCPDAQARAACPATATPCASEAELLATLGRRIRALDPDVVTGWNIIDFDVPVLIRRAEAAGVALEWGRAPGALRQRGTGRRRFSDSIFIPGRVVLDGIRLLRAVSMRLERYSLEAAAQQILGEGKTLGGGAAAHAERIMHAFAHDTERFVAYNLTDARLVLDILEKLELVPFTVERSKLTGMPPDRVAASIAAFDFLYLSQLRPHRVVAPTVGTELDAAGAQAPMQGGHVLPSRPGLHDRVLLFDFKSLYPSIIRTFQVDPLGLIREDRAAGGAAGDAIEAPNGARFRRRRGILSTLLDDLFASREQAKEAGNAVASHAIKVLMNSFYGVLGTSACRFYDPRLANAITSFGKHFLLWAKAWMERRGLEVLYGDTDSLFVAGGAAPEGSRLAAELNADLAAYVAATWRLQSYLEMEFETLVRAAVPAAGARRRTRCHQALRGAGAGRAPLHRYGGGAARLDRTRPRSAARAVPADVRRRTGRSVPAAGDRRGDRWPPRRPSRVPQDVAQGRARVPGAAAPCRGSPQTRRDDSHRRRARDLHTAGRDRLRDHRGRTGTGRRPYPAPRLRTLHRTSDPAGRGTGAGRPAPRLRRGAPQRTPARVVPSAPADVAARVSCNGEAWSDMLFAIG